MKTILAILVCFISLTAQGQTDSITLSDREYNDLLVAPQIVASADSVLLYHKDERITDLYYKIAQQDLLIRSKDAEISIQKSEVKIQKVKVVKRTLLAIVIGAVESTAIGYLLFHH